MTEAKNRSLNKRGMVIVSFIVALSCFVFQAATAYAQEGMQAANTQTIVMEFVPETGCPVEVTSARTELGFDSFGLPVFGKTYIDYKNASDKAIKAVKFRVRYLDQTGASRGTFHANDEAFVPAGATAAGKFAHYKLRKNIQQAKIRVLAVKFSDGSSWESVRLKEIMKAQEEGNELEHDDDAAPPAPKVDSVAPTAPEVSPPVSQPSAPTTPPVVPGVPAEKPAEAAAPAIEPLTAKPAESAPAQPAIPPAEATSPAPATSQGESKASPPVEAEPLSATPQALPVKKNADAFSGE